MAENGIRPDVHQLHIIAEVGALPIVNDFMAGCCRAFGLDDEATFAIRLAVDEATTNIIEHAYNGESGSIDLRCWIENCDVFVELRDRGKSFRPADVPPPTTRGPLRARRVGGLGLHFMRQMMDEIKFSQDDEGNRLLMIKRDVAP